MPLNYGKQQDESCAIIREFISLCVYEVSAKTLDFRDLERVTSKHCSLPQRSTRTHVVTQCREEIFYLDAGNIHQIPHLNTRQTFQHSLDFTRTHLKSPEFFSPFKLNRKLLLYLIDFSEYNKKRGECCSFPNEFLDESSKCYKIFTKFLL